MGGLTFVSSFFPSSTTLPPAAKRPPANKTSKSVSPYREKSSAVASRTCAHCTTSASLRMHAGAAKLQLAYAARAMMTVAWAFCMSISMQFAACNCRHCMTLACMNVSAARITAGCCLQGQGEGITFTPARRLVSRSSPSFWSSKMATTASAKDPGSRATAMFLLRVLICTPLQHSPSLSAVQHERAGRRLRDARKLPKSSKAAAIGNRASQHTSPATRRDAVLRGHGRHL